ncbi:MAG TPA: NAD(P)-dependent oxidoreductase [Thermoanaerobaculia bacterium]|nr:NAD(P)-dependent oxidoreductase [Thermoanaerobaculia bacterium]
MGEHTSGEHTARERTLRGRTLFVTGASRGIGKAIALRAAADGANVAIAAKTVEEHPKLPGTIHSAAAEVEAAGGRALALQVDIRDEEAVAAAVARTVETFGGLDVLVNNASALWLAGTLDTPVKRYDLMQQVNTRGTFVCSRAAIPHLERAANPHILTLSPPLDLDPRWLAPHVAYTISKYGMSLCVLGMAAELAERGIAVNGLWPRTVIDTAALAMLGGRIPAEATRRPDIVADAAWAVLTRPSRGCTGNLFVDEDVLRQEGVTDLDRYAVAAGHELASDLFLR